MWSVRSPRECERVSERERERLCECVQEGERKREGGE